MTVDTVVKIVESEKCGLDMSSYEDLHSSVTSPTNVGGNSNGNGDVRDDYVFVNDNDVASSDDHVENIENVVEDHESAANLGENLENGQVDVANVVENRENGAKLAENRGKEEVNVAKLSVEGDGNEIEKVVGDVESDTLENGVKVDGEGFTVENEVNENEERASGVEGGGRVVEDKEIELESEVVLVENGGGSDRNVEADVDDSDRVSEPIVDEVKEGSVPEPVVDEVKEDESVFETGDDDKPSVDSTCSRSLDADDLNNNSVSDVQESSPTANSVPDAPNHSEVPEGIVPDPVVNEVKELNNSESVIEVVKEDESVSDTGNNGAAPVDTIASRSLDVDDNNNNNSVPDPQEPAEVGTEDCATVNSAPDAQEPCEIKEGSLMDPAVDEVNESSDPKSVVEVVKEDEASSETGDNGDASVDINDPHSLDVESNNEISVSDSQESAVVDSEDNTTVNSVADPPEPSEVKEDTVLDAVVDEVSESNPDLAVNEVKEDVLIFETDDNGNVSVGQESVEAQTEDNSTLNNVTEASDPSMVKEGSVLDPVLDEVKESKNPEPVIDEAEDESAFETGSNNGNVPVDGISSRSLDVDDNSKNSVYDAHESAEVEAEDNTAVNGVPDAVKPFEVEAQINTAVVGVSEGELEAVQHSLPPPENGIEIQKSEIERLEEDQAEKPKVTENYGYGHGADSLVTEPKPLETDVSDLSVENGLGESHSFDGDGDIKVSLSVVDEDKGLSVGDAITTEHSFDSQQQNLPSADGENEEVDLIEAEAKIDEQGNVDPVPTKGSHESVDSKAVGLELDQGEISDLPAQPEETRDFHSLPNQPGAQNQGDLELAAPGIKNPVSIIVGQSGESKLGSLAGVEEIDGMVIANPELDTTDKSVLEDEPERVDEDRESEVVAETRGSQEASHVKDVLEGRVAEQAGSVDVVDKEISLDDCSSDKTSTLEDNRASDADQNDQGGSHSTDDTKSKTYTVDGETDLSVKSNCVSDGTVRPKISFGSFGDDINFPCDALNTPASANTANGETLLDSTENGDHSDGLNNDVICAEVAHPEQINDVSATSVKGSEAVSSDGQNINPDLVRRPFHWLIKVPRLDDGKYEDQLRQIEIELDEKTKTRDAFQAEFNKKQAYCRELKSNCEAVNSEVKAARELMWAKSREIDSAHSLMNLARHGITVEDLDKKIHDLEHRLQHQTLSNLKEEKELVREIKQLNIERQKLAANPQRQLEIQQARNQRDQTEEQFKVLKKEMDALRNNLSKADERFRAAKKKHDDEIVLLNELKNQLKSADDIRQEAYGHLRTLKKQLNEKNAPFYKAKDDLRLAYNYASAGKTDALERHCVNQVEKVMEIWNKNDGFRKEYIQCNMRRIVWKFGTLDGTCLGIDEVPPPLGDVSNNRVNISAKVNSVTPVLTVKRDLPVEPKITEAKILKNVEQKKALPVKKNEVISKINLAKVSSGNDIEEVKEEPKLTKEEEESARKAEQLRREEEELARKAEQLRQEEEAVRLREQLKLEEKAKAVEALERKRKIAMKAQARAEFKARKEAEEKEKEKEKRAMKKQKKKRGINSELTEKESVPSSEPLSESVKETTDVTEKPVTMAKRPQKASLHLKQIKTTKPIPPALRNKGKRGLLRYWPYACIVLLAVALFYLGSYETIQTLKQHISALLHR